MFQALGFNYGVSTRKTRRRSKTLSRTFGSDRSSGPCCGSRRMAARRRWEATRTSSPFQTANPPDLHDQDRSDPHQFFGDEDLIRFFALDLPFQITESRQQPGMEHYLGNRCSNRTFNLASYFLLSETARPRPNVLTPRRTQRRRSLQERAEAVAGLLNAGGPFGRFHPFRSSRLSVEQPQPFRRVPPDRFQVIRGPL